MTFANSRLEALIDRRQAGFNRTTEHQKAEAEFKTLLAKVAAKLPEGDADLRDLTDAVAALEVLGFTGGYKAGVTDLMTAVTFNQLGITKPEYAESAPTDQVIGASR